MFNLSTVYQLPFGKGKPFMSNPGFGRTLLGNWEVSAIRTVQTGLPVNITIDRSESKCSGSFSISGEERPNYVYGVSPTPAGEIDSYSLDQCRGVLRACFADFWRPGAKCISSTGITTGSGSSKVRASHRAV